MMLFLLRLFLYSQYATRQKVVTKLQQGTSFNSMITETRDCGIELLFFSVILDFENGWLAREFQYKLRINLRGGTDP